MNRDARLGASVRRGRDADRPPRRIPEGIHARIGTGILTPKRTRLTWRLFRDPPAGRYEPMVLAFHGPAIPLLLVLTRSGLLASDAGLIMQPERGTGVRASSGETPTDLVPPSTPAAAAFSIVGASNFAPHTAAIKTRPSKRRPRRPTTDVCRSLAMRLCCRGCFLPTVRDLFRPKPCKRSFGRILNVQKITIR